jgi:WXG100 family type VII secretion target
MNDLTDLAVDYPAMQAARDELAAISQSLRDEHTKLAADMAAFLDGDWAGRAADSFRTHFDEWAHAADTVLVGLGNEAALIDETMRLIRAHDEHIVGDLDRLVQRLGLV